MKVARAVWLIAAICIIGIALFGYQRAHTEEFKFRCAEYQTLHVPMGFPDNLICVAYWTVR